MSHMLSFPEKLDPYASGGGLLARGAHQHATLVYVLSLIWLYTCLGSAFHVYGRDDEFSAFVLPCRIYVFIYQMCTDYSVNKVFFFG